MKRKKKAIETGTPCDIENWNRRPVRAKSDLFLKKYTKKFGKNSRVLDVGCGEGFTLLDLQKSGYSKLYGIEYCPGLYKKTIAKFPMLSIVKGDAQKLKRYSSDSFDIVYCNHVLEHLPDPTLAISEAYRVLKKGGYYVVGIPNGKHANDRIMRILQKMYYGIKNSSKVYHKHEQDFNKSYSSKLVKFVSRYKITHHMLSLLPQGLKNMVTGRNAATNQSTASDYHIIKRNVDSAENLIAFCTK